MIIPQDELDTLPDVKDKTVLDLGNKKNKHGLYRTQYLQMGVRSYDCIDWNGQDGAEVLDLRKPLPEPVLRRNIVTNFGFSEHVTVQAPLWQNILRLVGDHLVCVTPKPGHWDAHGYWQPDLAWYDELARGNGFAVEVGRINTNRRRHTVCVRLRRQKHMPFVMPKRHMYRTPLEYQAKDL